MAALTRKLLKLFGASGSASDFGQFGSLADATKVTSKDLDTLQANAAWAEGWQDATLANNRPAYQDFNGWQYVHAYELFYLYEKGIAEWIATQTYYIGSFAQDGSGNLYKSIQDTNLNHALSDASWWTPLTFYTPVTGGTKALNIAYASTTTITAAADEIIVSSGDKITSFSHTMNSAGTGANGLDAGSLSTNQAWYLWAIRKVDGTNAVLASLSGTAPTMPSGYTQKTLIGGFRTDGSSHIIPFLQRGKYYFYTPGLSMASGNNSGVLTTFSTATFVPPLLSKTVMTKTEAGAGACAVSPISTDVGAYSGSKFLTGDATSYSGYFSTVPIITADTLYFAGNATNSNVYCYGYIIDQVALN